LPRSSLWPATIKEIALGDPRFTPHAPPHCGEVYVDEQAVAQLLEEAAAAARAGTEINVRHFQTASLS